MPADSESATWRALAQGTRLVVVFHPELRQCTPHEISVARALERINEDYPDTLVVTVLPPDGELSYPLPGSPLVVTKGSHAAEGLLAPRPRLEVWNSVRQPLLFKSLPRVSTEDGTYTELFWTRSFTEPTEASISANGPPR